MNRIVRTGYASRLLVEKDRELRRPGLGLRNMVRVVQTDREKLLGMRNRRLQPDLGERNWPAASASLARALQSRRSRRQKRDHVARQLRCLHRQVNNRISKDNSDPGAGGMCKPGDLQRAPSVRLYRIKLERVVPHDLALALFRHP